MHGLRRSQAYRVKQLQWQTPPVSTTADSTASRIASTAAKPAAPEASGLKWSDVAPDAEARLNAYLVNHNEYAGNGMRGVLPYVRIVGYQSLAGDYR